MSVLTRPAIGSYPVRRSILADVDQNVDKNVDQYKASPLACGPTPRRTPQRVTRAIRAAQPPAPPVELVILVPAYQPDMRLAELVSDLGRNLPGCQVLVVDGHSSDRTREIVSALAAGIWSCRTVRGSRASRDGRCIELTAA